MAVDSILRRNVIADTVVVGLIRDRFYPGELATVERPRYPCANFVFEGGVPDPDVKEVATKTIKIWTWSKESYDNTRAIYSAIRDVIDNERFADDDCYAVFKMITEPSDYFIALDKIYSTTGLFRCKTIGRQ